MVEYMLMSDLQRKDIVNTTDGAKLGRIVDIDVNKDGHINHLVIEPQKICSLPPAISTSALGIFSNLSILRRLSKTSGGRSCPRLKKSSRFCTPVVSSPCLMVVRLSAKLLPK